MTGEVSMGQVAFEAVTQYIASNVPDDIPEVSNEWSDLPPAYREAWEAGAKAVLTESMMRHSKAPDSRVVLNAENKFGEER